MTATLSPEQKTQPAIRPAAEVAPATARSVDERPDAPDLQVVPGGPAALHVDHVTKRFVVGRGKPPVVAIDAVSLRLERGEIVGILADRGLRDERECRCEFLGAPARFPLGPLLLAGLLQQGGGWPRGQACRRFLPDLFLSVLAVAGSAARDDGRGSGRHAAQQRRGGGAHRVGRGGDRRPGGARRRLRGFP